MAKIRPIAGVQSMSGKIKSNSDFMYITKQNTQETFSRVIGKRDKEKHPVRDNEVKTHTKMQEATAAYHELKQNIEQYRQFKEQYAEAVKEGWYSDLYRYFLHLWMDEGKNSVTLKIAKSKSSEETYVKGMQRCQTIVEADRLLVDFVEKLGYKQLAGAYKEIRKKHE